MKIAQKYERNFIFYFSVFLATDTCKIFHFGVYYSWVKSGEVFTKVVKR